MKYFSYLNSAVEIIGLYKGAQPFHLFLKAFFKQHKKYGSSDRKQVTHLCYCYFRLGGSIAHVPIPEKILSALFLCAEQPHNLLAALKPEWNAQVHVAVTDKYHLLNLDIKHPAIFPCTEEISDSIDQRVFIFSHLQQPDVFLRIRPGHRQTVLQKLEQQKLLFSLPAQNAIALPNTTKIDQLLQVNKEVVVQDYSSQRTGQLLKLIKLPSGQPLKIWDCCAASGGKSIMAKDLLGSIDLTVSDIRESVLIKLRERFAAAKMEPYKALVTDAAAPAVDLAPASFDLIIADVPCTGSGTWGRTPERLLFFKKTEIERYSVLQRKIVHTALRYLRPGGYLFYITCSVFRKENEGMIDQLLTGKRIDLIKMETITGYTDKADTMFAALLKKTD